MKKIDNIAYRTNISRLKNDEQSLLVWLFVILMFASIPPFFFWGISSLVYAISSIGFFLFGLWEKPKNFTRRASLLLFILFYIYASFNLYEGLGLIGKLWNWYRLFFAFTLFFISDEYWPKIYKKLLLVYVVTLIPSLLVYFVVIWGRIDLPHTIISPLNELKSYQYLAYPFMVITNSFDSFRFCGYYDEPGVIGNISGVMLVVNQCNMKEWKNWVLLISGLFSFSLFFYGIVFLYILFFGSVKTKIALIIAIGFVITYLATSDNVFSDLILARLEFGDDGEWIGDNRTHASFEVFWDRFLHSDKLWFGYGHFYSSQVVNTGGQSYKHIIVDHGIIMSMIYVIAFLLYYLSYNIKKKNLLFGLMLVFAILFQRPFIAYIIYLFLMISPAAMIKCSVENSIVEQKRRRVKLRSNTQKHVALQGL